MLNNLQDIYSLPFFFPPASRNLFAAAEGRPPISGRVILGAVIIKHLGDLTDRETIAQIRENMFMQYFLGYSSFTNEEAFSDTLFVEIRKRLSLELLSKINEVIALHCLEIQDAKKKRDAYRVKNVLRNIF